MTGVSPSALRIWETRYSWPRSKRMENGYRQYSEIDIDEIKTVCREIANGTALRFLIEDGFVVLRKKQNDIPTAPKTNVHELTRPKSEPALELFNSLIKAIEVNDASKMMYLLQYGSSSLRPSERETAIIEPARKWIAAVKNTKKFNDDVDNINKLIASVKL